MQSLKVLCTPRKSVFDTQRRYTVLDISDLIKDNIDPAEFFEENQITEGMKTLLEQGFRRLEGKSTQGVFHLKQAMGGGKTHNLLALGLLAKYTEYRKQVMGDFYLPDPKLGSVKVVAFSGRQAMRLEVAADIRAMFNAPDRKTAEALLQAAIQKYASAAPRLSAWLEENLAEGFTVFDFPLEHRRSIRTTNSLERVNKEIRRRTRVVGVFPNEASCLRLISALLMETCEDWQIGKHYCVGKSSDC